MSYRLNKRCRIERENYYDDDSAGYVVTGTNTIIVQDAPTRLDFYMPRVALTKVQGLETEKTYTAFLHYSWQTPYDIREQDVFILTFPPHDPLYNKRFRIIGVSLESAHPTDPRGVLELTLTRIVESRSSDSI